jgi:hypothetical protein
MAIRFGLKTEKYINNQKKRKDRNNMNKRAQAALEFLTTYGWAFLVILIIIAAIAYFGILNPSKILPNRCNFGSEVQCLEYQISATGNTFKLRLKNGIGESIDVTSITLGSEGATAYSCTTPPTMPTAWNSGEIKDLTWSGCNSVAANMIAGQKGKVLTTVNFNTIAAGAAYGKQVQGEVYSTVI